MGIEALFEDIAHGAIGWIAEGIGAGTGGVEAVGAVLVGKANEALALTQEVQGVSGQEASHGDGYLRPKFCRPLSTPGRVALEESGFLGRIVGPVGLALPLGDAGVALDAFSVQIELYLVGRNPGVQAIANVAVRNGVESASPSRKDDNLDGLWVVPNSPIRRARWVKLVTRKILRSRTPPGGADE